MVGLLILVGALLLARPFWEPRLPEGTLVEVRGEVPRPGMHLLPTPTLATAVAAAGGDSAHLPDTPLHRGDRVVVSEDGVHVAPAGNPLLVALPVDVNIADAEALAAVPSIGPSTAARIVADRAERGRFYAIDDLSRVRGIGGAKLDEIRGFVTVGEPGERPPPVRMNLNVATAEQLERLPGIGPVTAARIVVDRDERGPFADVDALQRVKGVGPKTVERVRDRVTVE